MSIVSTSAFGPCHRDPHPAGHWPQVPRISVARSSRRFGRGTTGCIIVESNRMGARIGSSGFVGSQACSRYQLGNNIQPRHPVNPEGPVLTPTRWLHPLDANGRCQVYAGYMGLWPPAPHTPGSGHVTHSRYSSTDRLGLVFVVVRGPLWGM